MSDQNLPMREWTLNELLDFIMPKAETLKMHPTGLSYQAATNSWEFRNTMVYGDQNSGKTELFRWLAQEGVKRYSPDLFDCYNMGPNIAKWLAGPTFSIKPIQSYYFEDSDLIKLKAAEAQNWTMLRHIAKQASHCDEGMLLTFIGTHEIFSLPKVLRQNVKVFIAKSVPTALNFWDMHFMKRLLGANGYAMVEDMTRKRLLRQEHQELIVFRILGEIGWMPSPMAKENYLCAYDWKAPIVRTKPRGT